MAAQHCRIGAVMQPLQLILLLLLLAIASAVTDSASKPQLLQVTLFFRHGDRTAMRPLPVDPHLLVQQRLGPAQLLESGVRQHFQLGAWVRSRYGNWLPGQFNVTTMQIRSTATDRTLMSALAHVSGLFPEQCSKPNKLMPACYPVPIYSEPRVTDHLLKMNSPCPAYERRWRQFRGRSDGPYARARVEFEGLASLAAEKTGLGGQGKDSVSVLWQVADSVTSWQRMGLALPAWVNASVISALIELKGRKFIWMFEDAELHSVRAGLLVATILRDMRLRINGTSNKQLQLYSAHDSGVSVLLHAFGVFNGLQPPMAACIVAELYSDGEVRLLYKNDTGPGQPYNLAMPFCPEPCSLDRLEAAMRQRGVWAESAAAMCGVGDFYDSRGQLEPLDEPYMSILLIVAAACVSIVLLL